MNKIYININKKCQKLLILHGKLCNISEDTFSFNINASFNIGLHCLKLSK